MTSDPLGNRRSAEVFHDPDTGQLVVRLHMDSEEAPQDFWVSTVNVQLTYPGHIAHYGERNFVRPSATARGH